MNRKLKNQICKMLDNLIHLEIELAILKVREYFNMDYYEFQPYYREWLRN